MKEPKINFNVIDIDWKNIENIPDDITNVLYQVYGDSPIYGLNTLLYIGKTDNIERRNIEHNKSDFERINNRSYKIGIIDFDKSKEMMPEKLLSICENILITMLKPSYNSSSIKDINDDFKNDKYLLLNKNDRGIIPLEVSNIWW